MKRAMACAFAVAAGWSVLLAAGPARCETQTVEHTIRSGDNLHLIAGYYYRDPRQWKKIWKLNRSKLRSPNHLAPGRVLQVESAPGQGWEIPYDEFRSRVRGK